VTQNLEYLVKFGPIGWLLDRLVMKKKLTATLDSVFESLVRHAEEPHDPLAPAVRQPRDLYWSLASTVVR
jgi:hypothetical protein